MSNPKHRSDVRAEQREKREALARAEKAEAELIQVKASLAALIASVRVNCNHLKWRGVPTVPDNLHEAADLAERHLATSSASEPTTENGECLQDCDAAGVPCPKREPTCRCSQVEEGFVAVCPAHGERTSDPTPEHSWRSTGGEAAMVAYECTRCGAKKYQICGQDEGNPPGRCTNEAEPKVVEKQPHEMCICRPCAFHSERGEVAVSRTNGAASQRLSAVDQMIKDHASELADWKRRALKAEAELDEKDARTDNPLPFDEKELREILTSYRHDLLGRHRIGYSEPLPDAIKTASLIARIGKLLETPPRTETTLPDPWALAQACWDAVPFGCDGQASLEAIHNVLKAALTGGEGPR